jgi:hypothetical protein
MIDKLHAKICELLQKALLWVISTVDLDCQRQLYPSITFSRSFDFVWSFSSTGIELIILRVLFILTIIFHYYTDHDPIATSEPDGDCNNSYPIMITVLYDCLSNVREFLSCNNVLCEFLVIIPFSFLAFIIDYSVSNSLVRTV